MSEQNTSVASGSKVKDPRRVAAGKRLGAISRKAKEEKALRLNQQRTVLSFWTTAPALRPLKTALTNW